MSQLPTGNVTFLFTDIEGSSHLWELYPMVMGNALAVHDAILRDSITSNSGVVFKTVGDAFCAVFNEAPHALAAAAMAQRKLAGTKWETPVEIRVRMAIHTGVAELRASDYFGPTLNRIARLIAAGNGGQTLISRATEELANDRLPPGVTLRDLGERRLKDLTRPERIFELIIEGLPTDFPPLRSLERFPNNLPVQLTSFVGREREVAEVRGRLQATHLLTLTGAGGTGKTRLSLQVAADLLEQYPDGVWMVELATLSEPELLAATVAEVLGVRAAETGMSVEAALAYFVQQKSLLLILDNCEHLIAEVARLATALLRASAMLRILATSQSPLAIAGETTWAVPPLSMPEPTRWGDLQKYSVADLETFESVKLFVDRAVAVQPSFRLTPENAMAVAQICFRLDGIPLALELAAARVKMLPPEQIAARLTNRFQLLTGGSRTALPRQQTLRALVDWSYDLLSEKERVLFRRLAVFAAGRTLEAVEAVCVGEEIEDWEVLDLLTQLFDKSLLSIEETGEGGEVRYVISESVWQYAKDKLAQSPEKDAISNRHLAWYRQLAEKAEPYLYGPDQGQWLERLAPERINFRLALEWAIADASRVEEGLRLAVALARFWEVRSYLKEGRDCYEQMLEKADPTPRRLLAQAIGCAGRLAWCQDANLVASEYTQRAMAMAREVGDELSVGGFMGTLGFILRLEGEVDTAEKHFVDALEIAKRLGDVHLEALAYAGLGSIAADRGDFVKSKELKSIALESMRKLGDRYLIGLNAWSRGRISLKLGDLGESLNSYQECMEIALTLGNRWIVPHLLEGVGEICEHEQEFEKGTRLFAAASVLRTRLGLDFAPADLKEYEATLEKLKKGLGPERYNEVWIEGREIGPKAAIGLAFPSITIPGSH